MAGMTSRGWAFAVAFLAPLCLRTVPRLPAQATGELTGVTADPSNQDGHRCKFAGHQSANEHGRANGIE